MKTLSRRKLCVALPAIAGLRGVLSAQTHSSEFPAPKGVRPEGKGGAQSEASGVPIAGGGTLGGTRVIAFEAMVARPNASGGESRDVVHGMLATGETVNIHESVQVAGQAAPALHVIQHSEFICVREGELELQHEVDGKVVAERVGAGGVIYVAFGTRHAARNVGPVPAKYFVVSIGGDAK